MGEVVQGPWKPKESYKLADEAITREDLDGLVNWLGYAGDEGRAVGVNPQLTQGPRVKEFEEAFAKHTGFKHAVFVNSGSSANLLAADVATMVKLEQASETADESEDARLKVIVPAVAWATSVTPFMKLGLPGCRPFLCEADEDTWGLDPKDLRRLCEAYRPAVVLLVHMLGVPCKVDEIAALKKEFGFTLIEDACGAFGSSPVGTLGDLTTFSTYYGHQLATVEGGFVCTNDEFMDKTLRMLRSHGWAADLDDDTRARLARTAKVERFRERFTFYLSGYNLRGDEIRATLGLSQLTRAEATAKARHRNHSQYIELFAGTGFETQWRSGERIASIGFGVLAKSSAHRDKVAAALAEKGIETRPVGGGNMARQPFWYGAYGQSQRKRPMADRIHDCAFQLPNHPGLTPEDIAYIADTVLKVTP